MNECRCEDIDVKDVRVVRDDTSALVHEVCNGVYDPAARAASEHRSNPAGPYMPNVEYRGMTVEDGT